MEGKLLSPGPPHCLGGQHLVTLPARRYQNSQVGLEGVIDISKTLKAHLNSMGLVKLAFDLF